ncbi:MAG: general secretion pathway protein GspK [Polyangiaceae bacterium]|nr:general secretion pathway protein GspK [Polyangiaceae bacterium]
MVLGAIAILTVMLAEFQDETSAELAAATADRDSVQAEYMARSAVNLARLLVASEPTLRKAIAPLFQLMKKTPPQLPVWEFSDRLLGAFNDEEASKDFARTVGLDVSLGKNLGMPGGRWELVIVDEDAKINVNLGASNDIAHIRLAKELMGLIAPLQYSTIFEQRDGSGQYNDRSSVCQALIDWADPDEQGFNCDLTQMSTAQSTGVEDAWYQLLPKPYRRKNAPYDSLEELRMVRGISEDFWATFVNPDPTNPKKRVMTVWGQGAVNVNTANAQTLLGVVCAGAPTADICVNPDQASMFLTGVTMARGITMGAPLFGSPKDFVAAMTGQGQIGPLLTAMGMKPVVFKSNADFANSITTESKVFSIYAVGIKKGYRRETRTLIHAVVDFRNAPDLSAAANATGVAGTTGAATTTTTAQTTQASNPNSVASAMQPSTGGQVIFYRVE